MKSKAEKFIFMIYDIHIGKVLGLPGQILAFIVSLVAASLPVTGFYIWWGRKKKNGSSIKELPKEISKNYFVKKWESKYLAGQRWRKPERS